MKEDPNLAPYGSAHDLPSMIELKRQILGFKRLRLFLARDIREQIDALEDQKDRLANLVDEFYRLLGSRNWIFTDDFVLDEIQSIVALPSAMEAEERLIQYYQSKNRIAVPLKRLYRFEEMRPRISLLEKALVDYEAGRYYSTVLVLLSVMDGFVNDLDLARQRGLHARSSEEMVAWDSVVGHHLGLSHAHQSFIKGYYKTDSTEIRELARNGIMHGVLVNYDNAVVATKAWNRLFAVADWADSKKKQNEPSEPIPSLRELMVDVCKLGAYRARIDRWQAHDHDMTSRLEESSELSEICSDFLERWQKRQWGPMGAHFAQFKIPRPTIGTLAKVAKDLYQEFSLTEWQILRIRHVAPAVAYVDVRLVVNSQLLNAELRWVHNDENEQPVAEFESGKWKLAPYGPNVFLRNGK